MGGKREEIALGLIFFEKISGIILLIVGLILLSLTSLSMGELGGAISSFLIIAGVIIAFLGLLMLIAKGE